MEGGYYDILLWLHVVLMGYWIGSDLCVSLLAGRLAKADALPEQEGERLWTLLRDMTWHPRSALILTMGVGFTLAAQLGLARLDNAALVTLWLGALAWLVLARPGMGWFGVKRDQTPLPIDWDLRVRQMLALTFAFIGVQSLLNDGPLAARWLTIKVLLFAAVLVCGIFVREHLQRAADAWRRSTSAAASGAQQETIGRNLSLAQRWSQLSWILLLVIAWCGVMKPGSP